MSACIDIRHVLPVPGPVWGLYPQRPAEDTAPPWRRPRWGSALWHCQRVAAAAAAHAAAWPAQGSEAHVQALLALRLRLRREGLQPPAVAQALGAASALAAQVLGTTPRPTQCVAAAALLDNRMAEMATGEGKTLAIGLAAAVAALAGVPVHVVTANDYLAARDAAQMAPLFGALGLRVATLAGAEGDEARRAIYGHDVVYATAKALAFDSLRDRLAGGVARDAERLAASVAGQAGQNGQTGQKPLMRGLCMALLDEADSILLDEAEVPLILSRNVPQAARRAFLWQALALARQLESGRHFTLHAPDRRASLTAAGDAQLATLAAGLGGPWARVRYRREAVHIALAALHVFRRNEHYVVRNGAIELLDEVTGRIAAGRVWSRGLHTVVALKEGLTPTPETETLAQTTFQRFFLRYWRLCGISGTLWEARAELRAVYGLPTLRVPLHQPCRRLQGPPRRFADQPALWRAVAARVAALQAAGRPVLVGTDSVADSLALSALLHAAGITHRVLNALNDAEEAAIVAAAGAGGCLTVATRMAGRGTDIALDDAARAAGGLHVLSCQHNPSRRLDRQLAGRAGRHGDPGSAEAWCLRSPSDPARSSDTSGVAAEAQEILRAAEKMTRGHVWATGVEAWLISIGRRWPQWREERRRTTLRRSLLQQDLDWERRLSFAGPPA